MAGKVIIQAKKEEIEKMAIKFCTAHAVAKYSLSFKVYSTIHILDQDKGLNVCQNYLNDNKAQEFVSFIAEEVRNIGTILQCKHGLII